jgi:hypothetical protein
VGGIFAGIALFSWVVAGVQGGVFAIVVGLCTLNQVDP